MRSQRAPGNLLASEQSRSAKNQEKMKYAAPLDFCIQLGKSAAIQGWTLSQLTAWCANGGFKPAGLTFRRILKAYSAQLACA